MFCIKCGTQLPDSANYCLNCGEHTKPGGAQVLGRWKYGEFSAKLDGREYGATGYPINGSIPWDGAISSIAREVRELVNRVGSDGWEPTEPIEVDRLWRTKRISGTNRVGGLFDTKIYWRPHIVKINFRRWVSGGPTDVPHEPPKTEFRVTLEAIGPNKINVIKAVRGVTKLGLREAKNLVEAALPVTVLEDVPEGQAEAARQRLENAGAIVQVT